MKEYITGRKRKSADYALLLNTFVLVDTSVWIDFFRGIESGYRRILHDLIENDKDICLADIIVTEILQGIKEDNQFEDVRSYLLEFPTYSAKNIGTFIQAAQIYRIFHKSGKTVKKTIDSIIASIAIENAFELFHNDRDFDLIDECTGLKIFRA